MITARLARLRGSLLPEEPGARGLERVALNAGCQRLRALTMIGVTPATAMKTVYKEPHREGQSPFALAAGNRFERALFENGAAGLLDLYRTAGRLTTAERALTDRGGIDEVQGPWLDHPTISPAPGSSMTTTCR